jgi:hypothetical protein
MWVWNSFVQIAEDGEGFTTFGLQQPLEMRKQQLISSWQDSAQRERHRERHTECFEIQLNLGRAAAV